MGSFLSKEEGDAALQLCKGRLRHIEQAISARYALSAAHLCYEQSLHNVAGALRQFAEAHLCSNLESSTLQHVDGAHFPIIQEPLSADATQMNSLGSLPMTADPSEARFAAKEKHIPILFGQTPQIDSSTFWDYFDPNYSIENMASHIPDKNSGRESFSELQDWSHPGGDSHSPVRSIDEIVEVQEQFNNTPNCVVINTDISKGFMSSMEELEHQFIRAAESCSDVSRMFETRKKGVNVLSQMTGKSSSAMSKLLICCKARNATSNGNEHHTKVITWNSSLSPWSWSSRNPGMSAQKEGEPPESCDLVEEFCLTSGSHASSLDRLYAWERKLYNELKRRCQYLHSASQCLVGIHLVVVPTMCVPDMAAVGFGHCGTIWYSKG